MLTGKILVLGENGMLGSELLNQINAKNLPFISTYHSASEGKSEKISSNSIKFNAATSKIESIFDLHGDITHVVNCIGVVKQSSKARDLDYMYEVNSAFPSNLGLAAREREIRVIHLSTDCVFLGTKGNYVEENETDATDHYGLSKIGGEKIIEYGAMVIRTSMIGLENSAVKKGLLEWFLSMQGKSVLGYSNVFFSGLTTRRLSRVILDVITKDKITSGIWHIASEKISKLALLEEIKRRFDLTIEIEPVDVARLDRSLNAQKGSRILGIEIPSWESMLAEEDWSEN